MAEAALAACPLLRAEVEAVAAPLGVSVAPAGPGCPCTGPPPSGAPGARDGQGAGLVCALVARDAPPTCFHLVAADALVEELLAGGAHLVTPGWLRGWRGHLAAMGLDRATAAALFGECARRIVLLDTGVGPDPGPELEALARHLGLPAERRWVGLARLRRRARRALRQGGSPRGRPVAGSAPLPRRRTHGAPRHAAR